MHYDLPPWSISILPDCKTTVFNTARVGVQSTQMKMDWIGGFTWEQYNEDINSYDDNLFTTDGLLEQINATRDATDYLWYTTYVDVDRGEKILQNGQDPILTAMSADHSLHVFVNGQLAGTAYGSLEDSKLTYSGSVKLWAGSNRISMLSSSVGLPSLFNAPDGNEPLALDMGSMGKGQAWINGQNIGRYWPGYKVAGSCNPCDYRGVYNETKCRANCGEASQRWYHVPCSWLNPTGNLLVVLEEWGGDPTGISIVKITTGSACADISEWQPSMKNWHTKDYERSKVHLSCSPGQKMTKIKFASFGIPNGACGSFSEGCCHAHESYDPFEKNCIGNGSCAVTIVPEVFGGDPCPGKMKRIAVEAICE